MRGCFFVVVVVTCWLPEDWRFSHHCCWWCFTRVVVVSEYLYLKNKNDMKKTTNVSVQN